MTAGYHPILTYCPLVISLDEQPEDDERSLLSAGYHPILSAAYHSHIRSSA